MQRYFGALTIMLFITLVVTRSMMMKRQGIEKFHFGKLDKTDFLIPPFPPFYFYLIFAAAFGLPSPARQEFFHSEAIAWMGVFLCASGLILLTWSIISFGQSFRIGIDVEHPDKLITTGAFALSRNSIFTAFVLIMLGQFLIFPNWILLVYLVAGFWLFNRQVLREEVYLKVHYGQEYKDYSQRVRRYL